MDKKREFEYHKLGPSLVYKDGPEYREAEKALNTAYKNKEIKNIAITGIYGSGKSSFLKTYFDDRKNEMRINVAIADFESSADQKGKENSNKIKVVERQLINQILYQISPYKIPRSKYRIKYNKGWLETFLLSLWIFILIVELLSIFNSDLFNDFLPSNNIFKYIRMVFLTLFLFVTSVWIARRANFKFIKFNFKGTESEIMEDDSNELLDIEAREIVYLILSSKVRTVIFEDLDRFDDISIFIRLREINNLVNSQSKEPVRFIYVIRDDLFKSKDRTKFFDLIIPIIPAVTSHNSKGKIEEIFSDIEGKNLKIDYEILQQISIYIDDMRIMYSIRNEYEIYSKSIDSDVYSNELFALVVLKNVFPRGYEELERDRGYFYNILTKKNSLIIEYQNSLNSKIKEREDLKNLIVDNLSDFLAMNIPDSYQFKEESSKGKIMYDWYRNPESQKWVTKNMIGKNYNLEEFIKELSESDPSLEKRLKQIDYKDPIVKIDSLDKEIDELNKKIEKRYTAKMSRLLAELDDDELKKFFEEGLSEEDENNITKSHYFNLVRYLFLSGLIDENYWIYKGYFYEGQLGKEDNKFINRVLSGNTIENNYHLNNPDVVMEYLNDKDYSRKDIVNYDLISKLIDESKSKNLNSVLMVIILNNDLKAINHISNYDYLKLKKLVNLILDIGFENFNYIFNSSIIPSDLKLKMSGLTCEYNDLNPDVNFIDYIRVHSEILELDFFEDKSLIINGLDRLKVKFNDVSNLELEEYVAKKIVENRLFVMNFKNSFDLIANINDEPVKIEKFLKYLSEEQFSEIKKYLYENKDDVINDYIEELNRKETYSESGEKQFIELLNSDLITENKLKLIKKEKTVIIEASNIEYDDILTELFSHNLVLYNKENIDYYYNQLGEITLIVDYINIHYIGEIPFDNNIYLELLNCGNTDNSLYEKVSNKFNGKIEFINSGLGIDKYKILSSNELIEFNKQNFDILKSEEDKDVIIEYLMSAKNVRSSEEIYEVLIEEDFTEPLREFTIEDILDSNILEDGDSIDLINNYGQCISLFDIENSKDTVKKHIIENYFSESDYEKIAQDFSDFNFKNEIISKLKSESSQWKSFIQNDIPLETMDLLIKESNVSEYMKIDMIEKSINNREYPDMWGEWISVVETISKIATVFNNKRPFYKLEEEERITTALKEIGIISISDKVSNTNQIFLRPKKFDELLSQVKKEK